MNIIRFNRQMLPLFLLFHLIGLAPFHQPYSSNQHRTPFPARIAARSLAIGYACICSGILVHIYRTKIDIYNQQLNELADQFLLLSFLVAHLLVQCDALARWRRQRRCCRRMFEALRFARSAAGRLGCSIDAGHLLRRQARRTWLMWAMCAGGTSAMCAHNYEWSYVAWAAWSKLVLHTRMLHIAVFVEWLGVLQLAQAQALQQASAGRGRGREAGRVLDACVELYDRTAALAAEVGRCFGWSMSVLLVHCIILVMNVSYWLVFNVYTLRSGPITICEWLRWRCGDLTVSIFVMRQHFFVIKPHRFVSQMLHLVVRTFASYTFSNIFFYKIESMKI